MGLELVLRHHEEHDEEDGFAVEGIELDADGGAPESGYDLADLRGGGVRDRDAEADAGAHGFLALTDGFEDGLLVGAIDFAGCHKAVNQLLDGLPAFLGSHLGDDLRL